LKAVFAGGFLALAGRTQGSDVKKRLQQQAGFTLVELLIVVAIIGIIASIGVAQVMRARLVANETSAIGSMRTVNSAQMSYSAAAGQGGFATGLVVLATPCAGGTTPFIAAELNPAAASATPAGASGLLKSGYIVDLVGNGIAGPPDCNGAPTNGDYTATAVPRSVGASGDRGFNTSARGTIFFDPNGLGTGTTPIQ
jgi:type IV pilus assembly protein PilA